jgi:tripartite ATP-independent transporter DctM subunit
MVLSVVSGTFLVLLLAGVPIAVVLGLSSVTGLLVRGDIPLFMVGQRLFGGMDSFTMLAVPLFILGGALMESGGIASRLMDLARSLVGHFRGGLAQVVIVGEMFFSDISGSTSADTAAIGSVMIPEMAKTGYSRERATAITAAACGMGMLIPPCITMVIYGVIANVSIGALFAAGFVPAAIMAAFLMLQINLQARRWGIPAEPKASSVERFRRFKAAALPLGMPVIIFGGILGGVVTVTEAAVLAVLYAVLVSVLAYRTLDLKTTFRILVDAGVTSGVIMLLIGMATLLGWLLAVEQLPQQFADIITGLPGGKVSFLIFVNLVFLVFGMLLEGVPALILLVPIVLPIASRLGIDPIHFGTMLVANQGIAVMLPPIGISLLVACRVGRVRLEKVTPILVPYLLVMMATLFLVAFVPEVSLALPRLLRLI